MAGVLVTETAQLAVSIQAVRKVPSAFIPMKKTSIYRLGN